MRKLAVVLVNGICWTICRVIDWRYETRWTDPEYED